MRIVGVVAKVLVGLWTLVWGVGVTLWLLLLLLLHATGDNDLCWSPPPGHSPQASTQWQWLPPGLACSYPADAAPDDPEREVTIRPGWTVPLLAVGGAVPLIVTLVATLSIRPARRPRHQTA